MRRRRWSELEDGSRRALLARANTGVPHPWFPDEATIDGHGAVFDRGAGVWGAFDDAGSCLAVAGVVTCNLPTTGEVFVTGLAGEPEGLRWLVRVAMSEAQAAGAVTVRAGAAPDALAAAEVLGEAGFDEVGRLCTLATRAPVAGVPLALRPVQEEDLARCVALFNRSFAGTPNAAVLDEAQVRAARDRPGGAGFAVHDGVEVGVFELAVEGGVGVIEGLALAPEHRGRGLGRPLLAACVERLRALPGVGPEVRLTVMDHHHPAVDLYLRAGFVHVGVRSRWFARTLGRR